jgi:hypothetical protein
MHYSDAESAKVILILTLNDFELFEVWLEYNWAATSEYIVDVIDSVLIASLIQSLH